jgi:hypothetical protein
MNELSSTEPEAVWKCLAPHLDNALGELSEVDRDALLLRYFQRKSAREMARTLGIGEEAAQKRVNRAVDRLRELFVKRRVSVSADGLVLVISANAIQTAPAGLAVTISAAAALAGATLATGAAGNTIPTILMTTLQKTFLAATIAAALGTGFYEARQASRLRGQVQTLQEQQAPLARQIEQLQRERDDATNRLTLLAQENARMRRSPSELLKLRGQVGVLREEKQALTDASAAKTFTKGFGTLGEYVPVKDVSDAGYNTAESFVTTFLWAMRENKLAQANGSQGQPQADASPTATQANASQGEPQANASQGEPQADASPNEAKVNQLVQTILAHTAGFRLSSRLAGEGPKGPKYEVHCEAVPLSDSPDDAIANGFNFTLSLQQNPDGWGPTHP